MTFRPQAMLSNVFEDWHQGRPRLSADSLSLSGLQLVSNVRITAALISLNGHFRIRR